MPNHGTDPIVEQNWGFLPITRVWVMRFWSNNFWWQDNNHIYLDYKILRYVDTFYVHGTSKKKIFTEMLCFLNSVIKEFTWFHDWWLAKSWTPIVEQLFHSWAISLISGCLSWHTSLFWPVGSIKDWWCDFDICSTIGHLMFHKWGENLFHDRIWLFSFFSVRNNFFFILRND